MIGRDDDARLRDTDNNDRTLRIAELNDTLRCRGTGGTLAVTAGVLALGDAALPQIMRQLAGFTEFSADNDPHGEHDFGVILHGSSKLFWKIDAYDRAMQFGSPDPADPSVTTRVLTIMLAEEW